MRIAYITSSSFVDTDFPLIRQLVKNGHEIALFIKLHPSGLRSTLFDIPEQYPHPGVYESSVYGGVIDFYKDYLGLKTIYVINHLKDGVTWSDFKLLKQEISLIRKFNPDVIQHVAWPFFTDIPLSFVFRKKFVITIHDPLPHELNSHAKKMRILRLATNWVNSHYILLNDTQTEGFMSYYHVSNKKIHFASIGNVEVMRLFGKEIKDAPKTILFYGRISKYKGVEYLLKSFELIKSKYPDVKLIIAGSGKFHFDISPYKDDRQIEFINRFITLEEMGSLIKNCLFAVCPYISATQSGVVASIHALNKPVIVTNVGGLPKMVEDRKTGIIIPPCDEVVLSQSMDELLSNPSIIQDMVKNIRQSAEEGKNSWKEIAYKYENVYELID